jgi:hypothetical protein
VAITKGKIILAGVATIGIVAAGSGAVMASTSYGNRAYEACVMKKSHLVRIVGVKEKCAKDEVRIGWNQKGQTGATGATGAIGATGAKGDKGDKGDKGLDGMRIVTAPTTEVTSKNSFGKFSDHGFTFGPFTNSSNEGGSVIDTTLRGLHVRDLAALAYSAGYNGTNNGDAPYLRVFIDNNHDGFTGAADDHDIIFSPSTQPGACQAYGHGVDPEQCNISGRLVKYDVTKGTVRYDDDAATAADSAWDEIVNAHGDDVIDSVRVSAGYSLPGTTDAFLNSISYEVAGHAPVTVSFSK